MRSVKFYLPAVLAMAFWATNFVFSIPVIGVLGPVQMTGARWFISLLLLIPVALLTEKLDWTVTRGELGLHFLQSLLGYSGYTVLLYYALTSTSSFSASIVVALNPALISIGARLFLAEHLPARSIFGIAISFIGAVVVVLGGGSGGELSFSIGDVLVILATIAWTSYVMVSPRVKTPPITTTAVQSLLAGATMIPFMLVDIAFGNEGWMHLDGNLWLGVIWIGLVPSAGAYFLWNISAKLIGPTRSGAFLNLIPVFTALLVVFFGGEVTPMQVLGGAVVLVGVSFANARKNNQTKSLT